MKQVHVECFPDERLVSKLGFTKKYITHHHGKAKVFNRLNRSKSVLALVDEDPGTGKSNYEKSLVPQEEKFGIKLFSDKNGNKICVLSGELEAWVTDVCKVAKIRPVDFDLPETPKDLKDVILKRLDKFGNLIDELIRNNNPAIMQLRNWLQ